MKPLYECDWCSFRGTVDVVRNHELHCKYNPINIEKEEKAKWIAEHCKYRKQCWDEYDDYWGCEKHGYRGRHTPSCHPCADCLQYCKGEDVSERY